MQASTLSTPTPTIKPTAAEMESQVQAVIRQIQDATANLLATLSLAEPREAESMRSEVGRLNSIGFTLTRCLAYGQPEQAFAIISGDVVDGEVVGLVA